MACPRCHSSTNRVEIAPGYFQCRGEIEWDGPAAVPGGIYTYRDPCREQYQEGSQGSDTTKLCRCRTFAVRLCHSCPEPLCGLHGTPYRDPKTGEDIFLCDRCSADQERVKVAAAEREQDAHLASYRHLPAASREDLLAWIDGEVVLEDGKTHHFFDLTNHDIVEVLRARLGEFTSLSMRELWPATFHRDGHVSWTDGWGQGLRGRRGPEERFNYAPRECQEPGVRAGVHHRLPKLLVKAVRFEMDQREIRAKSAEHRRSTDRLREICGWTALAASILAIVFAVAAYLKVLQPPIEGVLVTVGVLTLIAITSLIVMPKPPPSAEPQRASTLYSTRPNHD